MFFGNANPFGAFFDEDDHQDQGFGGAFPGMFRFSGSQFGPGGPNMHQQMAGQPASKVLRLVIDKFKFSNHS